ncbi:SSI family serine proteinase inhibitor [Herbidospora mongoliensis]|uniref:SSI family serine proteinase inhibitor n=1 Tax=Herbidospora mongoliensis TaxID=688067 RepID=UPI00082B18B7|nr:SSI family serine proteinase inhibitor [Herbidospora mongoliensis]
MRTVLAAALIAIPLFAASPAAAEAPSALVLSRSVAGGAPVTTTLICGGVGSLHPKAAEACELLRSVGGRFEALNVNPDAICTKEYHPHAVTATGIWEGQRVSWQKTFGNRCGLISVTGSVFDF